MTRTTKNIAALAIATTITLSTSALADHYEHGTPEARSFVQACDTDKDGKVSREEMRQRMERLFDKADTNKEGKLDAKQVEFFLRELVKALG